MIEGLTFSQALTSRRRDFGDVIGAEAPPPRPVKPTARAWYKRPGIWIAVALAGVVIWRWIGGRKRGPFGSRDR
jgi:hypothetical protein